MSKLLELTAKIGIGYFVLFIIFYIGRFVYAWQAFMKFHSTPTGVDFAHTIIAGSIVFEKDVTGSSGSMIFTILALLAVIGAGIWFYQFKWGEQPATVS
jgi:hypothetical protein